MTGLDTLPASAQTWKMMDKEVEAAEVGEAAGEEAMMEAVCAIAATGRDILLASALKETEGTRGEVVVQSATDVTGWDILQENVRREMETMVAAVEEEEIEIMEAVDLNATSVIDSDISHASVARKKIVATSVMGLVTLQGIAAKTRIHATIAMRLGIS